MAFLTPAHRDALKTAVQRAREAAEAGARQALEGLAVGHSKPFAFMTEAQKELRNRLRARARQLGDVRAADDRHSLDNLLEACAYEHWHRMLFARFLAENNLLVNPEFGVPITLEECQEFAKEEGVDTWTLASRYAQRLLPQIFRPDDPVLAVDLPPEHASELQRLLLSLDRAVFLGEDALGWSYQYWQGDRKDAINDKGEKIGARQLAAVTQLFTEDYMVLFLIHNSLGAWHAGKMMAAKPDLFHSAASEEELRRALALPGVDWEYLRFIREEEAGWRPAAGTFAGWPARTRELKVLDPCCGSGHFLVVLLRHLTALRRAEEGLAPREAVNAVLRENLFGLELDERATQIAVFAVGLAAWTYPGAGGYRPLPPVRIACTGVAPRVKEAEWLAIADGDMRLQGGLRKLYALFQHAPTLGSLMDPERQLADKTFGAAGVDAFAADYSEIKPVLKTWLDQQRSSRHYEELELGQAAQTIVEAMELLQEHFHAVLTNVPYLASGKQDATLKEFIAKWHPAAKADLATAFVERCLRYCKQGGTAALVTPQNWLFLGSYKKLREKLLTTASWNGVARLGAGAFQTISGEVVNVALLMFSNSSPEERQQFFGIDVSSGRNSTNKANVLQSENSQDQPSLKIIEQNTQLTNTDTVIALDSIQSESMLSDFAVGLAGVLNGDTSRFEFCFWEIGDIGTIWEFEQSTVTTTQNFGGKYKVILWENGNGRLRAFAAETRERLHDADRRGNAAWGKWCIGISQMGPLPATLIAGNKFDTNIAVILPKKGEHLLPIWAYCISDQYKSNVRKVSQKLNVTNATLVKVPFDLDYWTENSKKNFPTGLPTPYSEDPTQWLFKGVAAPSDQPLHVATAKLLGYRWPAELDPEKAGVEITDADRAHWALLAPFADADGIVPLFSLKGEPAAADRLRKMLAAVYGDAWSPQKEHELLQQAGAESDSLDEWLRDEFFAQHCKLFHHRPFLWHLWDGRRDGFHVLVNYHKLAAPEGQGRRTLENLIYGYLGDWITRQQQAVKAGEGGAEARLLAAQDLKKRLEQILEGNPPFDLFIRWKPLAQQPVGWDPDINDGVRLNIRPFMAEDIEGGKAGAGVLRWKPNIKWGDDRGREPKRSKEDFPWFWDGDNFTGIRVNGWHLTPAEKQIARTPKKFGVS